MLTLPSSVRVFLAIGCVDMRGSFDALAGQVRGVQRMIEDDAYCIDILTQVSAATKALDALALALLDEHLRHCVTEAIQAGGDDADVKVREASAAIARLVKS